MIIGLTQVPTAVAAVTVSSFTAQLQAGSIVLNWTTATEVDNLGFNLYRSTVNILQKGTKVNANLVPSLCLGCIVGTTYSYTDSGAGSGQTYYYVLESIDTNGASQLFGPAPALSSAATATRTSTPRTPTLTRVPPTATQTSVPATQSPMLAPPSATPTSVRSTPLSIAIPATATATRPAAIVVTTSSPGASLAGSRQPTSVPSARPSPKIAYVAPVTAPTAKPSGVGTSALPMDRSDSGIPVPAEPMSDSGAQNKAANENSDEAAKVESSTGSEVLDQRVSILQIFGLVLGAGVLGIASLGFGALGVFFYARSRPR